MKNYKKKYSLFLLVLLTSLSKVDSFAQQYGTGYILDEKSYEKVPLVPPTRGWKLPSSSSLKPYAPTPKNQGTLGNCVGWTTSYVSYTILQSVANGLTDQAEIDENTFSPFFVYECAKSNTDTDCHEGTNMYAALEAMKEIGTIKYKDFEKECGKLITNQHKNQAENYKIANYRRLFENYSVGKEEKIRKIKTSISEGKPVMIGMQCCHQSFLSVTGQVWQPQATDLENEPQGGHAITVIAYDDNKFGGAFELMNSWGTSWGNDGFIWMRYEDFARYCFEAYEMNILSEKVVKLEGELNFKLSAGMNMKASHKGEFYYEMEESYNSGTQFQFHITNKQPAYVYAFVSDLSKQNYQVFPHDKKISPYLAYRSSEIVFPDEEHYIQLDDNVGTDYFCVFYSSQKLDMDSILEQIQNADGDFKERVKTVLDDKMINLEDAKYSKDGKISFEGIGKGEKILVPIIVAINHI